LQKKKVNTMWGALNQSSLIGGENEAREYLKEFVDIDYRRIVSITWVILLVREYIIYKAFYLL
jgi:hypothetical protein